MSGGAETNGYSFYPVDESGNWVTTVSDPPTIYIDNGERAVDIVKILMSKKIVRLRTARQAIDLIEAVREIL
jgi:hypothetical protein